MKKVYQRLANKKVGYRYHFNKELCRDCPKLIECAGNRAKKKVLHVGENSQEYYEYSQLAKTEEFKQKYKKRASHEWKNGEMKRFHGLDRARGYGLKSMSMQAKLTALVVNLKRIAALVSSNLDAFHDLITDFYSVPHLNLAVLWISF